jgi:hypothetical protein
VAKRTKYELQSFLHSPVTGSKYNYFQTPTIYVLHLSHNLCSSLKVTDQVSCPYETNKPTSCSRDLLEKLTVAQVVKKFSEFYGNQRFIIGFTRVFH